jgi:hypothetical protein
MQLPFEPKLYQGDAIEIVRKNKEVKACHVSDYPIANSLCSNRHIILLIPSRKKRNPNISLFHGLRVVYAAKSLGESGEMAVSV